MIARSKTTFHHLQGLKLGHEMVDKLRAEAKAKATQAKKQKYADSGKKKQAELQDVYHDCATRKLTES